MIHSIKHVRALSFNLIIILINILYILYYIFVHAREEIHKFTNSQIHKFTNFVVGGMYSNVTLFVVDTTSWYVDMK